MANTAPPLFLASFLITFFLTLVTGVVLLKLGFCALDDKSKYPIGLTPSEATPLNSNSTPHSDKQTTS